MISADPDSERSPGLEPPAVDLGFSLEEAWRFGASKLKAAGVDEPHLEAEVLLRAVLDLSKASLLMRLHEHLPPERWEAYQTLLHRRIQHEPTAYLLGRREFFGLDFLVDRRVLVPRPESELLVEMTLEIADPCRSSAVQPLKVADIGTGSGAIAVALATHLPEALIYAVDRDVAALGVAAANSRRLGVADRVRIVEGDLLAALPEPVGIVVANLPYIPSAHLPLLAPEVSRWEPKGALDGGADGLDLIRRLLSQATHRLQRPGYLLLEADPDQMGPIAGFARRVLPGARAEVRRDLAGNGRVIRFDLED